MDLLTCINMHVVENPASAAFITFNRPSNPSTGSTSIAALLVMSGIEVAGLVFGAFPLIISAMEHGRSFVKVSQLHHRMRKEYYNCRSDVQFYQIWYQRNLQSLLHSIVCEQNEVDKLLADPVADAWKDDGLQTLLEESLRDSYSIYMNIMQRMNETMEKLKKKLCVDEKNLQSQLAVTQPGIQRSPSPSSQSSTFSRLTEARSRWDYETFRFKFSFGDTTRKELFEELKECNTRLEKLLLFSNKAPPPQNSTTNAASTQTSRLKSVFKAAHKNSTALYKAIQTSWQCSCQEHHYANLQLEHRTAAEGISFRMILDSSSEAASGGHQWTRRGLSFKQITQGCTCSVELCQAPFSSQSPHPPSQPTPKTTVLLQNNPNPLRPQQSIMSGMKKSKPKKVVIQAPDPGDSPMPAPAPTDVPLCKTLGDSKNRGSCLGTVSHEGQRYHIEPLAGPRDEEATVWDSVSLDDRPSRRQRYLIALLIASSIAQLQYTPWLPQGLTRSNILFYSFLSDDGGRKDQHRKPFIRTGFSHAASEGSTAAWSVQLLGIMLLELCFGQRLEDHPSRPKYTAATPEEEQMLDLVVAMTWAKGVEDEAGYDYGAAVDWCLKGGSKNIQARGAWRDDIIKNVIIPLGKCQSHWESASLAAST